MPAFNPSAPAYDSPDRDFWRIDPGLMKVRTNAVEFKLGANDTGQSGPVRLVQQAIRFWGARHRSAKADLLPSFGVDGHFGLESKAALCDFQTANLDKAGQALAPDGILGDLTLGALEKYVLAPLPKPPTPPAETGVLEVRVDFVPFPDGVHMACIPQMLKVANAVFLGSDKREGAGIRLVEGTRMGAIQSKELARTALAANKALKAGAPVRYVVGAATVENEVATEELRALVRFANRMRPTVYLVDLFPQSIQGLQGTTKTQRVNGVPPTILLPKPYHLDDVFYHEMAHALLDSVEEDHKTGTVTENPPDPKNRTNAITAEQREAMRATAARWV